MPVMPVMPPLRLLVSRHSSQVAAIRNVLVRGLTNSKRSVHTTRLYLSPQQGSRPLGHDDSRKDLMISIIRTFIPYYRTNTCRYIALI